ncbi:MAG: enoyl-CoA hydratase [Holophagales bacterium]|nr:enoyl-CoA hydratase [Holophagales bacterium]MYF04189.1 enoyl-CoA hydratase [Holophagales bacterium]MYJ25944.1 enoyl-CoA hydratase [Holophagales bacterium]
MAAEPIRPARVRSRAMSNVRLESDGDIARITLTRRRKANALDSATTAALREAVVASAGASPRVVVLAGEGVFCGGADIREMEDLDAVDAERFIRGLHRAFLAIREHPAPVVAEVRGAALGAGLELLVSCDLSVAGDDAIFGMPEPHVGLPSVIEAALLPSIVGLVRARELLFLGDPINAAEAARIGLVGEVVPASEVEAAVNAKVERLLRLSPEALSLQKRLIGRWLNLPLDQSVEAGVSAFRAAFGTDGPKREMKKFWRRRD